MMPTKTAQPWHLYRCVLCHIGSLNGSNVVDGKGEAKCMSCGTVYPVNCNTVDTLLQPSQSVVEELRGLAAERGLPLDRWADVKLRRVDHVPTLEERLAGSAAEPVQYYQQTTESFEQALAVVGVSSGSRVLEVGPHDPFWFLDRFRRLGAECFALNVLYFYEELDVFAPWPHKALGDMNNMPYQDATFDLVLLSATAHHSSDLDALFGEIARVLVPGGRALVLNEPVEGLVKRLSGAKGHGRDEHINEHTYRVWDYTSAMRSFDFEWISLFPDFVDRRLRSGNLHEQTRFASVARLVARAWGIARFRRFARSRLLWPAQATIGLPLNVVLFKSRMLDSER